MTILVTGASGYVGSRLVPRLLRDGHPVRVAVSDASKSLPWWRHQVEVVEMDALDPHAVSAAVEGVASVFYLIHGMSDVDFADTDHQAAQNMAAALSAHRVERVVYLSGIVPDVPEYELSEHLASRLEVEATLTGSSAVSIVLRAAIVIGSGSASFEVVRQVSERMPVATIPTWLDSTVQPIAVVDALEALVGALTVDGPSRSYDIGGPERLRYADLLARYARVAGLRRPQVHVPLVPRRIVQEVVGGAVDVPATVVRSLIESLRHDMICHDQDFIDALLPAGYATLGIEEAIRRALTPQPADPTISDPMGALAHDPPWASGGRGGSLGSTVARAMSWVVPGKR